MSLNLCPKCGSGKVELEGTLLAGGASAFCQSCGWWGTQKELVTTSMEQVLKANANAEDLVAGGDAGTAIALMVAKDFMTKLSEYASQPIGLAMIASGLVGRKDVKTLTRVLRAACLGAHKAALEEMNNIQKELQGDGLGN